jgi:hypothetical protein
MLSYKGGVRKLRVPQTGVRFLHYYDRPIRNYELHKNLVIVVAMV